MLPEGLTIELDNGVIYWTNETGNISENHVFSLSFY